VSSLVELINAKIGEEEKVALEADQRGNDWWWGSDSEPGAEQHIALNPPPRTIRRARAYRRLLAIHSPSPFGGCTGCGQNELGGWVIDDVNRCPSLLAVADELGYLCGAKATFWPDVEACEAECILHIGHSGERHEDEILGEWDEDDLITTGRFDR